MKTERVYSKNATYQRFEVLKTNRNKRYTYGEFWIEGVRNINEARKNGWEFSSLLFSREKPLSHWAEETLQGVRTRVNYELPLSLMRELSGKEDTSELLAIGKMRKDSFEELRLSPTPLLALFDRPSNRGNLGTILRSCDALGVDGLILTGHGVDLYDPEVIVASMGSFFCVPTIRVPENQSVVEFIARAGNIRSFRPSALRRTRKARFSIWISRAPRCFSSATKRTGCAAPSKKVATRWQRFP